MSYFPVYQPPPGGLTRLRARLDERPERRWAFVVGAVMAMLLALVFGLRIVRASAPLEVEPSTAAFALGLARVGSGEVVISSSAPVAALNGVDAQVRVYALMAEVTAVPTSR